MFFVNGVLMGLDVGVQVVLGSFFCHLDRDSFSFLLYYTHKYLLKTIFFMV